VLNLLSDIRRRRRGGSSMELLRMWLNLPGAFSETHRQALASSKPLQQVDLAFIVPTAAKLEVAASRSLIEDFYICWQYYADAPHMIAYVDAFVCHQKELGCRDCRVWDGWKPGRLILLSLP